MLLKAPDLNYFGGWLLVSANEEEAIEFTVQRAAKRRLFILRVVRAQRGRLPLHVDECN